MNKVYIYETDDGFDLFLRSRELTDSERYCSQCDEYSQLLKVTTDVNDLISLFKDYGYTEDTAKYQELILEFKDIAGGINGRCNSKKTD